MRQAAVVALALDGSEQKCISAARDLTVAVTDLHTGVPSAATFATRLTPCTLIAAEPDTRR